MATIEYRTFHFKKPETLNQKDFETLKKILSEKPFFNINPMNSFWNNFKGDFFVLGVSLLGLIIAFLEISEWLSIICAFIMLMGVFHLFRFIPSLISYIGFIVEKASYYKKLKKDIIVSKNYIEFLNYRSKK
jgi:hypothetical protein